MKRALSLAAIAAIVAIGGLFAGTPSAEAQSYGVGIAAGIGTDASHKFDGSSFDNRNFEALAHVEIEPEILLRLRLARMDLKSQDRAVDPDSRYEKVGFDVEYQFARSYYTSGIFLGGGWYRFKSDEDRLPTWDDGKNHFGVYAGINGWFYLAHDFAIVPELSVERIAQKHSRTVGKASVALVFKF